MTETDPSDPPAAMSEPSIVGAAMGPVAGDAGPPTFAETQRRNLRALGAVLLVLASMVVIGGFTYRVPYVALVPGSARDTEPLIEVSGTEEYPSDGEVLFTTVRLTTRPNFWHYLWLTLDDDVEILPEEVILGDRTAEENREVNLQAMNDSKATAIAVALEELGYEAIEATGVFVADVVAGTAVDGLLERGDVIVAIDGREILTDVDLVEALRGRVPGVELVLTVEPLGSSEQTDIAVTPGPRDDDPDVAFLGVAPQTRLDYTAELPFEIEIDSGSVGGPSAGLAFTLAVLDQLTPGELTGGDRIAVTGTITPDGRVGPVGGVAQKASAVRDLGITVFIVPASLGAEELDKVREAAGDDLTIVPVADLDEALAALAAVGGETEVIEEFASGR